jgi:adenine C2-methylase RlmN of 23S rRNA A2503 and tRNA A37
MMMIVTKRQNINWITWVVCASNLYFSDISKFQNSKLKAIIYLIHPPPKKKKKKQRATKKWLFHEGIQGWIHMYK